MYGFSGLRYDPAYIYLVEQGQDRQPSQYLLTVEQMIENDYPIPSYLADVFQKPPGWVETPQMPTPAQSTPKDGKQEVARKIYAIDCEMVRFRLSGWDYPRVLIFFSV